MIIDCHTHVFPDALAPKAGASLSATAQLPLCSDLTVAGQLRVMREDGVDAAIVLNTVTNTHQVEKVNLFAVETAKRFPILFPFGSVHPSGERPEETVRRLHEQGIHGLKLHPDYLGIPFDDSSYLPILRTAAELQMPVVIHAGWDPVSPRLVHATPQKIQTVLHTVPELTLICAHLGGMQCWDDVEQLLCGERVWLDTAMCCERSGMKPEQALRIIRKHGADRILFGSDLPWARPSEILAFLNQLPLTPEERDAILYRNAETLFRFLPQNNGDHAILRP